MFAAGRILRNNRRLSAIPPVGLLVPPRVREKERRRFRCYMPFMWPALVMSCIGLLIIFAGVVMCFFGYYFRPFSVVVIAKDHSELFIGNNKRTSMLVPVAPSSTNSPSVTTAVSATTAVIYDQSSLPTYRGLIYVGPVVMSFGCFAIVFACVIVCETRDRALETMDDRVRQGLSELPAGGLRPDFYTLVVEHKLMHVVKQHRRRQHRHEETTNDSGEEQLRSHTGRASTNGGQRILNVDENCHTADVGRSTTPTINIFLHDDTVDGANTAGTTDANNRVEVGSLTELFSGSDRNVRKSDSVELVNRSSVSKSTVQLIVGSRLENGQHHEISTDATKWKSVPCVLPDNGFAKLLPSTSRRSSLLLDRFRYTASPPLTSLLRHVISGADSTFQTASFSKLNRHSNSSDFVDVTSRCSDNGIIKSASLVRSAASPTESPSDSLVTCGPSSGRTPTVVVHTASVHAANDDDDNDDHSAEESAVRDDDVHVNIVFGQSAAKSHNNANDGMANGCVSCEAPSGADTPHFQPLSIDACSTDNRTDNRTECPPVCRPIADIKTRFEWPRIQAENQSSVDGSSLVQRRMFTTHPPAPVSALPDNVSNRFRRRRRVLDSSTAGSCHTVSGGGDFVDTCAISSVPDSRLPPSAVDREMKCTGHSGSVVAYEYTDTILSSCNDSDAKSSSGAAVSSDIRSTSGFYHYAAPLTASRRLYVTRMRMWKAKRCSATGTTLPKHRSNISRPDNCESAVCNGSQSYDGSDNSSVVATYGGQKPRAIRKPRYRLPTITFTSTHKIRFPTSRGRHKRSTTLVDGPRQVT